MKKLYKKYKLYVDYIITSIICLVVDLGLFTLFLLLFENHIKAAIMVSSYLARIVSSVLSYYLNKWVFGYQKRSVKAFIEYFILVVVNITISGLLVTLLHNLIPIFATVIKAFVDGLMFISNFIIQKKFIFKIKKKS